MERWDVAVVVGDNPPELNRSMLTDRPSRIRSLGAKKPVPIPTCVNLVGFVDRKNLEGVDSHGMTCLCCVPGVLDPQSGRAHHRLGNKSVDDCAVCTSCTARPPPPLETAKDSQSARVLGQVPHRRHDKSLGPVW